jgi:hypothetical protein
LPRPVNSKATTKKKPVETGPSGWLPAAFDGSIAACNDVAMPDRNLKIVRFIGATPSVAFCDVCRLAFRTRQEFLLDSDKARQQLQSDFDNHECKPESGAVDDALQQIR